MDETTMFEAIGIESLLPLLASCLPFVGITVVFAWIVTTQFAGGKRTTATGEAGGAARGKRNAEPLDDIASQKTERKPAVVAPAGNKPSKKKQHSDKWNRDSKQNFSHEWLLTSLKGHTGPILDMSFSANGKFLATCAEDRAVFLWYTKDWKEKEHKFLRYNIDYDHASLINWSPDSKAFIYNRCMDNVLEVCKVSRKSDGSIASVSKALTFPKVHASETIGLGIAVNGKYIMTCSAGTDIVIWDLKGTELARLDTYLMNNYTAKISPCGRFIAASGFAPDVKVWEVVFTKSGEFKQVSRAFELTGHTSGVWDFSFNADSSRIATISKDGSWKVFNTKIEFEKGEEPHLLKTGKYKTESNRACLALSPDGQIIAIASASNLTLINFVTGQVDKMINNIYAGVITKVAFDSAGAYVLTAGEKHVRVFHNVTGYKANIQNARAKLKTSGNSSATKERLQGIIDDSEEFLTAIGEKIL